MPIAYARDAIKTGVKSLPDASPSMHQPAFSPSGFPSEPLQVAGDEPAVARPRDEVEPVPVPLPAPCRGCSRPRTSLYRRCERADGAGGLWMERWRDQSEGAFCSSASSARAERISSSTSSPRPFPIISFRNALARMCVYLKTRSICRASPRPVLATAGSVPTAVTAAEELPTNGGAEPVWAGHAPPGAAAGPELSRQGRRRRVWSRIRPPGGSISGVSSLHPSPPAIASSETGCGTASARLASAFFGTLAAIAAFVRQPGRRVSPGTGLRRRPSTPLQRGPGPLLPEHGGAEPDPVRRRRCGVCRFPPCRL